MRTSARLTRWRRARMAYPGLFAEESGGSPPEPPDHDEPGQEVHGTAGSARQPSAGHQPDADHAGRRQPQTLAELGRPDAPAQASQSSRLPRVVRLDTGLQLSVGRPFHDPTEPAGTVDHGPVG